MPDIQTNDVGRKLQNRYALIGPPPSPFLSPELVPVTIVDDLTQFDLLSPTFERPYEAELAVTAGVGFRPQINMINPFDSGVICIVEFMLGSASVLAQSTHQILDVIGGVIILNRGLPRDMRAGTFAEGACGLGSSISPTQGLQGRGFWAWETVPRGRELTPVDVILRPGTFLQSTFQVLDQTFSLYFRWRERLVLEGDLAFLRP